MNRPSGDFEFSCDSLFGQFFFFQSRYFIDQVRFGWCTNAFAFFLSCFKTGFCALADASPLLFCQRGENRLFLLPVGFYLFT